MKVVFIGCDKFKGTDTCGFQYSFYKDNFKPGDIFETYIEMIPEYFQACGAYIYDVTIYFRTHTATFPKRYFVTLQEWREMRLNQIGI